MSVSLRAAGNDLATGMASSRSGPRSCLVWDDYGSREILAMDSELSLISGGRSTPQGKLAAGALVLEARDLGIAGSKT